MDTPIKESTDISLEEVQTVIVDTATDEEDVYTPPKGEIINGKEYKPWMFKPGIAQNPGGRPKGKTLKEWTREYLASMTDAERLEFLAGMPKDVIWKQAEGNPTEDRNIKVSVPTPILGGLTQLHGEHQNTLDVGHDTAVHEVIESMVGDTQSQDTGSQIPPPMPQESNG